MKREELQIYDWVRYTDEDGTYNVQVKGITSDVYFRHPLSGFVHFAADYQFEPIPLTKEILKANGMTEKFKEFYVTDDGQLTVELAIGKWFVSVYADYKVLGSGFVEYVHELQHLLKLWNCNGILNVEIK